MDSLSASAYDDVKTGGRCPLSTKNQQNFFKDRAKMQKSVNEGVDISRNVLSTSTLEHQRKTINIENCAFSQNARYAPNELAPVPKKARVKSSIYTGASKIQRMVANSKYQMRGAQKDGQSRGAITAASPPLQLDQAGTETHSRISRRRRIRRDEPCNAPKVYRTGLKSVPQVW